MFPAAIIPEEVIRGALVDGLDEITTRFGNATIDEFLGQYYASLDASRLADWKAWLQSNRPVIQHGLLHDNPTLPSWNLMIDPEEEEEYVGSTGARYLNDAGDQRVTEASSWTSTVAVLTYDENADRVRYLYHLARSLVAARRPLLTGSVSQRPLKELHLSGRDLGFEQRFLRAGRLVYVRVLQCRCVYDNHIDLEVLSQIDDVQHTENTEVASGIDPNDFKSIVVPA